jgi:hypothetical protein
VQQPQLSRTCAWHRACSVRTTEDTTMDTSMQFGALERTLRSRSRRDNFMIGLVAVLLVVMGGLASLGMVTSVAVAVPAKAAPAGDTLSMTFPGPRLPSLPRPPSRPPITQVAGADDSLALTFPGPRLPSLPRPPSRPPTQLTA